MSINGLDNYVGIYRVRPNLDINGEFSDNKDDNYIKCKNHCQLFRYDKSTIGLDCFSAVYANKLMKQYSKYFTDKTLSDWEYQEKSFSGDTTLYIPEKNFKFMAQILGCETNGKNIKPLSVKNLKKEKIDYFPKNEDLLIEVKNLISEKMNGKVKTEYLPLYRNIALKLGFNLTSIKGIKFLNYLDQQDLLEKTKQIINEMEI